MALKTANDVLSYWFGDIESADYPIQRSDLWWGKDDAVDADIKAQFSETLVAAAAGKLADWKDTPRGLLGHIILLDQLSRNMHRNSPAMYALDHEAQDLVMLALENDTHLALTAIERPFLYMPLMHAENVALQRLCVRLFAQTVRHAPPAGVKGAEYVLGYAKQHEVIVERFGRFPHRNEILSRTSTPEEIAFLKEPGSSF